MAPPLAAAGVVDVGEEQGLGAHGVGGEHDPRSFVAADGVECGLGQARSGFGVRGRAKTRLGVAL